MKPLSLGLVLASAFWLLLPHGAAAQCEGGTTLAGQYLRNGAYWPGGCAFTNPTTPGQMYPSGAQPVPSTNPAAGASALPGQRVATGQLPVTDGDWGPYPNSGLPAGGLVNLGNGLGTTGPINGVTATEGLPPSTGTSTINGVSVSPNIVLPVSGVGAGAAPAAGVQHGVAPAPRVPLGGSAYGYSLPAAPAVSADAVSPTAPTTEAAAPLPGGSGPADIVEEPEDSTADAPPSQ